MNPFAVRQSVVGSALIAFSGFLLFVGCAGEEDETVPPPPPSATGTYYGIADFGAGEGQQTEHGVKLVLEVDPNWLAGGLSLSDLSSTDEQTLLGSIIYGDSSYEVSGIAGDDSLSLQWSTAEGAWTLLGTFDTERIQGIASGPSGSAALVLYRWTGNMRSIAGHWEGAFPIGPCWPQSVSMRASFVQSDTLISGYLVVSGHPWMGDTLRISEGSFFDPVIMITALDSTEGGPSTLCLFGILTAEDSMAGTCDWWWARCFGEESWYLAPEEPDTGNVFSGILAMAYRREGVSVTVSMASLYWMIGDSGVSGATVSVNSVPLIDAGGGFYVTVPGALNVIPGGDYVFNIFHPVHGSTLGTARVPGEFTVTSPFPGGIIPRGQPFVVTFAQAVDANFYTAMLDINTAFGVAVAPATSLVLPGAGIQTAGADVLEFEAMNGDYTRWQETNTGYFGVNAKAIDVTVQ
ncbi:MAG: hypothetical protein V1784_08075 [bacterium]